MANLAIIPARGGSKRIPRKNIKEFHGIPIIAYSIRAALDSGLFDEVMVSTDDLEIANISKFYGAKVPFMRSLKNSSDNATTFDVLEEVIDKYGTENHVNFKFVCCLYPCAPFIKKEYLIRAFEMLNQNNFDTVFPIVKYGNNILRALRVEDNKVKMIYPEYQTFRTQDLEISYYDPGQFYWAQTSRLIRNKQLYTSNSGFIIIDEINAQDIDNEIDWKLAEIKYLL
jgi:pseudaminic acid cytidylyltransferase